ncbi:hypothetical protein [Streptomyces sp. NPDC005302]|uniref:hypothetical protein n=1 Tax=Streptomyces sp. NPDC005302 TaxID=3154675 RepID=UPI0033BC0981
MAPVTDGLPALQLEDIQDETTEQLIARGAAYVREYAQIEHRPTILAMNIAMVLLAIRRNHGDWLGRSYDYRQVAGEVYRQANVRDGDQLVRLKTAVRYHVGNLLRRQLTPRELKSLELLDSSPIERQQDRRAVDAVILNATRIATSATASTPKPATTGTALKDEVVPEQGGGAGSGVKATADHLRLAEVATNILAQMSVGVIDDHMTAGQRAKLDEYLTSLQKTITSLRRHTKTPRSKG